MLGKILVNTSGTELAVRSARGESKAKKVTRAVFAGAMSVGLIGSFAFPAFAAQPEIAASVAPETQTQTLRTDVAPAPVILVEALSVEDDLVVLERERIEAAEAAAAEAAEAAEAQRLRVQEAGGEAGAAPAAAPEPQSVVYADVPSGAGAAGLLQAAYAQLGAAQDCTALVERSLRAIGHGVGDLGTAIWQYDAFGTRVSTDALAPGDILIYGNARSGAHVAIYAGNGQAVHGGMWGQGGTIVAGVHFPFEALTGAIRPF